MLSLGGPKKQQTIEEMNERDGQESTSMKDCHTGGILSSTGSTVHKIRKNESSHPIVNNVMIGDTQDCIPNSGLNVSNSHLAAKSAPDNGHGYDVIVLDKTTNNGTRGGVARERYLKVLAALCLIISAICIVLVILAFTKDKKEKMSEPCTSKNCVKVGMDFTVDPCDDFFQFACGTWNKQNVIPEDKSSFNAFEKLNVDLQKVLKGSLEVPIGQSSHETESTKQAKILYKSCMNLDVIERKGPAPLKKVLAEFGGWPPVEVNWTDPGHGIEGTLSRMFRKYLYKTIHLPLLTIDIATDERNSSLTTIKLDEPALGMPAPEYYSQPKAVKTYKKYIKGVALLLGADRQTVDSDVQDIIDFERKLVNVTTLRDKKRNKLAFYEKVTIGSLQKDAPQFNWLVFINQMMSPRVLTNEDTIVIFAREYLISMTRIAQSENPRVLASYVLWRLAHKFVPEISDEYRQQLNGYKKIIDGVNRERARWETCVQNTNENMMFAVGAMYVREHFDGDSKYQANKMIANIRQAFDELLTNNDWMDERIKKVAREKASDMKQLIGYPDKVMDRKLLDNEYQGLHFHKDRYVDNLLRIQSKKWQSVLATYGKPVNQTKWVYEVAVVNAFYNPNANAIVFPAGILQPLFYSPNFPKSLNYGGIGVVIGHEMTHGFDNTGRQYDKAGNMIDWWTNKTDRAFETRARCMQEQYSGYTLDPYGIKINGHSTVGENIADNGGLKQSFKAYKKWVSINGQEQPLPGIGLTHDQLFFLNYAQIWCGNIRRQHALKQSLNGAHPPGPIRVRGPLSNSEEFAKAYHCRLGSRMNPAKKCSVW